MWLLFPISVYTGFELTIIWFDFSKAFTTCLLGISHISYTNILYGNLNCSNKNKITLTFFIKCLKGILGFVLCILMSYLLKFIGTMSCIILVQMTIFAVSIFMVSWTPIESEGYSLYLVIIAFAVSQSISNGQIKGK